MSGYWTCEYVVNGWWWPPEFFRVFNRNFPCRCFNAEMILVYLVDTSSRCLRCWWNHSKYTQVSTRTLTHRSINIYKYNTNFDIQVSNFPTEQRRTCASLNGDPLLEIPTWRLDMWAVPRLQHLNVAFRAHWAHVHLGHSFRPAVQGPICCWWTPICWVVN